jgi:hypothetical protein
MNNNPGVFGKLSTTAGFIPGPSFRIVSASDWSFKISSQVLIPFFFGTKTILFNFNLHSAEIPCL